jgi:hypothetical protein
MQLAPAQIPSALLRSNGLGQEHIPAAQANGFLRPQSAVIQDAEERHQARATGTLCPNRFEQKSSLPGTNYDAPVDLRCNLWCLPLEILDGVLVDELELNGVLQSIDPTFSRSWNLAGCEELACRFAVVRPELAH